MLPRLAWRRLGVTAALAAALAAIAFGAANSRAVHPAPTDCKVSPGAHLALTPSYRFVLQIGPVEGMLMPYQVRANHVTHGEMMLRGQMVMPTRGPLHHLELHICAKATRMVVTNAHPTIVLIDETAHGHPSDLPIAVMQGIAAGRADLHYGNNVAMSHHHRYRITVTCTGERAVFHVLSP